MKKLALILLLAGIVPFLLFAKPCGAGTLAFSTYLGGEGNDTGHAIAADATGIYITGTTDSTDFSPGGSSLAGKNVFVTKIALDGDKRIYTIYLGGSSDDEGRGIAVDTDGNAYVTGFTSSIGSTTPTDNFPSTTPGIVSAESIRGIEAFVTKIDQDGEIVYSTYLGGSKDDKGLAIAVDSQGRAYVTGSTFSDDFPTVSSPLPTQICVELGNSDAFVTMISADGASAVYSTCLGGSLNDEGHGIAVDTVFNAYVTGQTISTNFPKTSDPLQSVNAGSFDAFVTKIKTNGASLVYSTYLGGSEDDSGNAIVVDSNGNAYITGGTDSTDLGSSASALQNKFGGGQGDIFIAKFGTAGSSLSYLTYLGGTDRDDGFGITVDAFSNAYVTGQTLSDDFPTSTPTQENNAGPAVEPFTHDAVIAKINKNGQSLLFSTYLGGKADDAGNGIAVDNGGNAYITGETGSDDLPITSFPLQGSLQGGVDLLIAKFDTSLSVVSTSPASNATAVSLDTKISVTFSEDMDAGTIATSSFTLTQSGVPVTGTVSYNKTTRTATFEAPLVVAASYTAKIIQNRADTPGVKDIDGNTMRSDFTWSFDTFPPPKEKKKLCFIATAAYGSYLDPHVMVLRRFRDRYLETNAPGRILVDFYYRRSPPIADYISRHERLRMITRWGLTPIVYAIAYPMASFLIFVSFLGVVMGRRRSDRALPVRTRGVGAMRAK
ncbi:MAG: SBBP repeat-containing protein [Nitrospirae bacterium]|nr:SBBP repeat-containing protein [Candidatus Troglogloeales bacterium]MBI3598243.1 SBBP repeat-containing protein [Candidatus Troglogloeales bacterium]